MSVDIKKMDALREAVRDLLLNPPPASQNDAAKFKGDIDELTDLTVRMVAHLPNVDRRLLDGTRRQDLIKEALGAAIDIRAVVTEAVSKFDAHAPLVADLSKEV